MKPLTTIVPHSTYRGVKIYRETGEGIAYFLFIDKLGNKHIRNTKKPGGTLTVLKADIDFYLSQGWV